MTTATPDEERRAPVRPLFASNPEPQRPDDTDAAYLRRVVYHDETNPDTYQPRENQ